MSQKESGKRPQQQMAPPSFPPPSCPRCYSDNTKFCYYNNYTVSQPRYYCKDCRRYWTHGGALRNIPTGGTTSRKRGRIDTSASSTSHVLLPPSTTFEFPSIGRGTLIRPPITETMISFNSGGSLNQTPFRFSPGGVSVGFGGGAPPPPPPARSNPLLSHFASVDGFRDFGFPVCQGSQHHVIPPPVWTTSQNMALNNNSTSTRTTLSNPNKFLSIATNVVGVNEWSEPNDIGYDEDDSLPTYKPPSP